MSQGGIEEGERPESAALRELKEEIGTNAVEILAQTKDWLQYDLPETSRSKSWGGRYCRAASKVVLDALSRA